MKEVVDTRRFKQKMLSLKQCLRLCPKALKCTKVLMMQSQVPYSCSYSPPASNKLLLENMHNYLNLPIKYY